MIIQNRIKEDTALILTAAGSSSRMKTGRKKEFELIGNKTVLETALIPFLKIDAIKIIIITITAVDFKITAELTTSFNSEKEIRFIEGGGTRQESVYLGLLALSEYSPEYVLIHDAARPWINTEIINNIIDKTRQFNGCIPVIPSVDALKTIDGNGFVKNHIDRSGVSGAQTPQGFKYDKILQAHKHASAEKRIYIDDSEIFSKYGGKVYTVPGSVKNRKITFRNDLE